MLFIAGRLTPTNVALLGAARDAGIDAVLLPVEDVVGRVRPGDLVLPRLDVLPTLDGVEPGTWLLDECERGGAVVVNGASALLAAHDKLATALRLACSGVPHPATAHVDGGYRAERQRFPVVVKPRFGSWGRDVFRCESRRELRARLDELSSRPWFAHQGALVQELVTPRGFDLRILVAAGSVVGAVRRVAAPGEWRTNIALGGHRECVVPPPDAVDAAVAAAAAIGGGFVGVDLLPTDSGWTVIELNGCVDFTREYGLFGCDPFTVAVTAIARLAEPARAALEPALV